ncbi:HdeD family acid-resistance protein [Corynebacterium kutscheri]|uniref:HdeD family acid-resistance protein n=1 Tax=Corynebacterium kutscheri TaxID=35755 RepID=UPI0037BFD697
MPQVKLARPFFLSGVLAIIVGLIIMAWPDITLVTLAIIWGIYAVADGISSFMRISGTQGGERFLNIFSGIIGIIAGIAVIAQPLLGMAILTWVLGFWMIVRGFVEIFAAFAAVKGSAKWWLVLAGVLWVIAGGFVMSYPGSAMIGIVSWLGFFSIVWGIALIVAGIQVRSVQRDAERAQEAEIIA